METTDFRTFERYRPLVDDWDAFCTALTRPLPTCIWANPLRTTPEAVARWLEGDGLATTPLPWYPGAFRLQGAERPGSRLAFLAGAYHVQEEVSLLPVVLLDPRPGERVLDLCAAPGNKTAQIAVAMRNRGTVVANDRDAWRARALSGVLDRLGVLNVAVTHYDAANYPPESGLFDRVLADVPCSCEGTSRKNPGILQMRGETVERLQGTQTAILRKAVQRCKPGGRIVYSTCTYAPEENEAVVDAVLRAYGPDVLRLRPARIPGFTATEGLTHWQGQTFHPSLRYALRAWPHHNDTGGFFVAVLEKQPDAASEPADEPAPQPRTDRQRWTALLETRFGIPPTCFDGYDLIEASRKYVALVPSDHRPPRRPAPEVLGLAFLRTQQRYPKLTTAAAMAFGHAATRNDIEMTRLQAGRYLRRRDCTITPAQAARCTDTGYVLVRYGGLTLGVGLFFPDGAGGGRVRSLYPKAWALA